MIELEFQFRALEAKDDRKNFCCGLIEFASYKNRHASV